MSTTAMPRVTKLGRWMTYHDGLSPITSHNPLIKWPKWSHVAILKIYISIFTILMATKLSRMLILGKNFIKCLSRHQPFVFFLLMCDQHRTSFTGYTGKLLCLHPEISCGGAWHPHALEIHSIGRFKREHVESCLSATRNKISPLPQGLWLPNVASR